MCTVQVIRLLLFGLCCNVGIVYFSKHGNGTFTNSHHSRDPKGGDGVKVLAFVKLAGTEHLGTSSTHRGDVVPAYNTNGGKPNIAHLVVICVDIEQTNVSLLWAIDFQNYLRRHRSRVNLRYGELLHGFQHCLLLENLCSCTYKSSNEEWNVEQRCIHVQEFELQRASKATQLTSDLGQCSNRSIKSGLPDVNRRYVYKWLPQNDVLGCTLVGNHENRAVTVAVVFCPKLSAVLSRWLCSPIFCSSSLEWDFGRRMFQKRKRRSQKIWVPNVWQTSRRPHKFM